jgi:hypothetical protein
LREGLGFSGGVASVRHHRVRVGLWLEKEDASDRWPHLSVPARGDDLPLRAQAACWAGPAFWPGPVDLHVAPFYLFLFKLFFSVFHFFENFCKIVSKPLKPHSKIF